MNNVIAFATLSNYLKLYPEDCAYLSDLTRMLRGDDDVTSRTHKRGHMTASAIVVNDRGQYLAIHHKNLNKMLCPGGHLEPDDASLMESALRELQEETGIAPSQVSAAHPLPVDVDRHNIPENDRKREAAHEHWDARFVFRLKARDTAVTVDQAEVTSYQWTDLSNLPKRLQDRVRHLVNA